MCHLVFRAEIVEEICHHVIAQLQSAPSDSAKTCQNELRRNSDRTQ